MTVTYGTNAAPYFAIRVVLKHATMHANGYPLAEKSISEDT